MAEAAQHPAAFPAEEPEVGSGRDSGDGDRLPSDAGQTEAATRGNVATDARGIGRHSGSGDGNAVPKIQTGDGVKISEQEVRRVAELANLALTEDEVVRMT